MDLGPTEKVALVTGATGGIGAAIARVLAAEGARVALGYRAGKDTADRLAAQIMQDGGAALLVHHDRPLLAAQNARLGRSGRRRRSGNHRRYTQGGPCPKEAS